VIIEATETLEPLEREMFAPYSNASRSC